MMMKGKWATALTVSMIMGCIAGTAVPAAADDDITLTFMASQDWIQDAEMELGEKFTEQTGIKVDYQIVPSDQYESLLMTKLNTGECTDLFGGQSSQFSIVSQFNVDDVISQHNCFLRQPYFDNVIDRIISVIIDGDW